MIWLLWLLLMLMIAAAPGVYLVLEQHAEARANADLSIHAMDDSTELSH